jgi:hypothetical protein
MKKSLEGFIGKLKRQILRIDQFGQKVELNVNGETSINSIFGTIVTLFIYITVSAFACYRFQVMVTYGNTSIT